VIGFDDIPLAGSPLIGKTTIKQPVEAMGKLAADRLVGDARTGQAVREILPVHLVQRASAGRAPQ
jgi:LacI family transcriptional regulator